MYIYIFYNYTCVSTFAIELNNELTELPLRRHMLEKIKYRLK